MWIDKIIGYDADSVEMLWQRYIDNDYQHHQLYGDIFSPGLDKHQYESIWRRYLAVKQLRLCVFPIRMYLTLLAYAGAIGIIIAITTITMAHSGIAWYWCAFTGASLGINLIFCSRRVIHRPLHYMSYRRPFRYIALRMRR